MTYNRVAETPSGSGAAGSGAGSGAAGSGAGSGAAGSGAGSGAAGSGAGSGAAGNGAGRGAAGSGAADHGAPASDGAATGAATEGATAATTADGAATDGAANANSTEDSITHDKFENLFTKFDYNFNSNKNSTWQKDCGFPIPVTPQGKRYAIEYYLHLEKHKIRLPKDIIHDLQHNRNINKFNDFEYYPELLTAYELLYQWFLAEFGSQHYWTKIAADHFIILGRKIPLYLNSSQQKEIEFIQNCRDYLEEANIRLNQTDNIHISTMIDLSQYTVTNHWHNDVASSSVY